MSNWINVIDKMPKLNTPVVGLTFDDEVVFCWLKKDSDYFWTEIVELLNVDTDYSAILGDDIFIRCWQHLPDIKGGI